MNTERQRLIVAEAEKWLGTPYHHQGDILGVGIDCAMILVRVFCDLGLVPMIDPRPYPPDWHLHQSGERFLGWVQKYATRVHQPEPGDVPLFRFGRALSHGGIVCEVTPTDAYMIHANMDAGKVERAEVRSYQHRLVGYWRVK
jgi:NlpC/P60 family putative phage cell wall peptidase